MKTSLSPSAKEVIASQIEMMQRELARVESAINSYEQAREKILAALATAEGQLAGNYEPKQKAPKK